MSLCVCVQFKDIVLRSAASVWSLKLNVKHITVGVIALAHMSSIQGDHVRVRPGEQPGTRFDIIDMCCWVLVLISDIYDVVLQWPPTVKTT